MMQNSLNNATTIWVCHYHAQHNIRALARRTHYNPTLKESWFFSPNTFSQNHPMFASSEVRRTTSDDTMFVLSSPFCAGQVWLLQSVAGIQPHPAVGTLLSLPPLFCPSESQNLFARGVKVDRTYPMV